MKLRQVNHSDRKSAAAGHTLRNRDGARCRLLSLSSFDDLDAGQCAGRNRRSYRVYPGHGVCQGSD